MAPWRVEGCTVEDAEVVARNNGAAFWQQPMWRLQWTNSDGGLAVTQDFLVEQLVKRAPTRLLRNRDTLRHQKAVDPTSADNRLVGYARWRLPDAAGKTTTTTTTPVEWTEAQVPDVVDAERRAALDAAAAGAWWAPRTDVDVLDADNNAVRRRVVGERPYLELEYLAVHPENQGKGVGTALVESGIRQAEKMGVPIVVVCYREVRGVYRRLGFVEMDRVVKDDRPYGGRGDYAWYFMLYEAPKAGII